MKYVVLDEAAFQNEYEKAFVLQDLETEAEKEKFRDEVFEIQGTVEEALLKKWKKVDDFEVGWGFNYCYHASGGIYSDRIFCKEYIDTVRSAIEEVTQTGVWTYHTSCEILVNPDGATPAETSEQRGEFFIRGDTCYINGSSMKIPWRRQLGCPD